MKNLILLLVSLLLFSCGNNSKENEIIQKNINVASITSKMGCENCGMNLKKFIATSHAIKLNNDESHFYCSINCSSIALDGFGENSKTVYGIDYGLTKYYPVENLNYVIGANLKGTMTKVSKFAFKDVEKAKSFQETFDGENILLYDEVYKMSKEEIASRSKSK